MKILMLAHNGFEEVEALTPIDILRRAGVSVSFISMTGNKLLKGSHNIDIIADGLYEEVADSIENFDGLILPGGLPNAHTLRDDERVISVVKSFYNENKLIAAICAAPCVFERAGLLVGKQATSYPGAIDTSKCHYQETATAVSGNIITSRGMGTAIPFALEILKQLGMEKEADKIGKGIMFN